MKLVNQKTKMHKTVLKKLYDKTIGFLMQRAGLHMQADYSQKTMFGTAYVYTVEGFNDVLGASDLPVRVLDVDGSMQSATYLDDDHVYDLIFAYDTYYDLAFDLNPRASNICMIGGGGYAYPKHLISTFPNKRIDVVEVDPAIEAIAHRYFFLDRLIEEFETEKDNRLGLICEDGLEYLKDYASRLQKDAPNQVSASAQSQGTAEKPFTCGASVLIQGNLPMQPYDVIMNDAFKSLDPSRDLATPEAAQVYADCLAPDGLYLSNVVGTPEGKDSEFLHAAQEALKCAFASVAIVPCYDPDSPDNEPEIPNNHMLIASKLPIEIPFAK